jgi:uncharacterized membrane protein
MNLKVFFSTVGVTLALDFCWIGLIMNRFYRSQIGSLLRLKENGTLDPIGWAAALVYVCIPLGVILFVLPRATPGSSTLSILPWGFLYGLLLYGVYDFTNYSLLKGWPLPVTIVDIAWGGTLCAAASVVALFVSRL